MFWGVLNSVLIGDLVYLSHGIDTLSVGIICCFILVSNRPKTMSHIFSRKKYTPLPPPPLQRTELLECIMSKILHTNLSTRVYIKMRNFFSEISPWKSACVLYARRNVFSSYEVICITRQKYEFEQLPTPSFMKHGE